MTMMRTFTSLLTLALGSCALLSTGPASALDRDPRGGQLEVSSQRRAEPVRARPRIVVTPARRIYRHCVDIYVIEHRLTGDTVVPDMRCWWAGR